jgi:imidazoleglycerol-phosphate dehydratase
MDVSVLEGFFKALADGARANVHIDLLTGRDFHHGAEAVFKSFARALRQAVAIDPRVVGVPSTKGIL